MSISGESGGVSHPTRRSMVGSLGLAGGAWLAAAARAEGRPEGPSSGAKGSVSVAAFGAVGDGKADDTPAFQAALNEAGKAGGIAAVSAGQFLLRGGLVVPPHVTLEGLFRSPTARSQGYGSTILSVGGRGQPGAAPQFLLQPNSALKGLTVYYPEQDAGAPVEYPWCVRGRGDNIAILDTLLVNPWNAVDFGTEPCGRHLIRGLYGQPLDTGIFVDRCLDCGRIEDVHFWPFWTNEPLARTKERGTAFRFARSDWQMLANVFCLGYRTGFHFTALAMDAGNALVLNSGADLCEVGVHVEYSQVQAGVLFTNCQVNAGVVVGEGSLGPVKFANCGLFGTGFGGLPYLAHEAARATHVLHRGQGRTSFVGCHFYHPEGPFVPKGYVAAGHPAVYSDGLGLTVSGCDFTGIDRQHIVLGPRSRSTLASGTRSLGPLEIVNGGKGKVVTGQNIDE